MRWGEVGREKITDRFGRVDRKEIEEKLKQAANLKFFRGLVWEWVGFTLGWILFIVAVC